MLALGNAKLILAMGTLPPTTLVRNSFPDVAAGERFGAHFISSIIARIPRADFIDSDELHDLELGAFYIAGKGKEGYTQQYHIQLTVISDKSPDENVKKALRYMPDVVATASKEQLKSSVGKVVFVCAVLGELDVTNPDSWFKQNTDDTDLTTNSKLQVTVNEKDKKTWNAMDDATFGILEEVLSPEGPQAVDYWHGSPDKGEWKKQRPSEEERRVDMLVHESSTLHIGEELSDPVDTNYCLRGTTNVYVTGASLWPRSGSWNPTLTMVALSQHLADQLVAEKKKRKIDARSAAIEHRISHDVGLSNS
ncbi:uncharacterized protein [Amphiura filiformis]|uniref:uncharacterized protein isoform X3 n=1 Tax=Amphiura filiformis TaxID=82378 RepID=UPI003B2186DA